MQLVSASKDEARAQEYAQRSRDYRNAATGLMQRLEPPGGHQTRAAVPAAAG